MARSRTNKSGNNNWMDSGSAGAERSKREVAKQVARREDLKNQGYKPFRLYVGKGQSAQIVILDHSMEDIRFYYEHSFYDQAKQDVLNPPELCAGDFGECPACSGELSPQDGHKRKYYAMFLSILDMRPFIRKARDGKPEERVAYTRKLIMIKSGQHEQFMEVLRNAEQKYGTLNGTVLKLSRANTSDSTGVGEPVIIHDGRQFAHFNKDTMMKKFSHREMKNKDGEVYLEANGNLEPFDYNEIFERPDPNSMRRRWGLEVKNEGVDNSEIYGQTNDSSEFDEFDEDFNNDEVTDNESPKQEPQSTDNARQDFDDFDESIPF